MKATLTEIEKYLAILAETPRSIAAATKAIDDARLGSKPDKQPWSTNDVLAHLRSCADMWGNSIYAMLAEDNPTLPDVHPRQWIKETNYPELAFRESFHAFVEQRERLLTTLKKLSFDDWLRAAMIGDRKHTVFSQARRMAKHEAEHVEQIESLLQMLHDIQAVNRYMKTAMRHREQQSSYIETQPGRDSAVGGSVEVKRKQ